MTNTKNECKIRLLDEVTAVVLGLNGDHLAALCKKYAVNAPNYFFNPLYKLGRWDGKVQYFSPAGRTYVYLIDEILPYIANLGYTITIEDLRASVKIIPEPITADMYAHIIHRETGEPTVLRDYQVNGVNELLAHGYGILKACTGAGKTILAAALVDSYGKHGIKTLTIVPSQDLIRNTKKDYEYYGLDVGEYSGTHKDIEHLHVVSTWQALKNHTELVKQFQLVLVDEAHGAKGTQLKNILVNSSAGILYRFGVTGTMPKEPSDLMTINVALGPIRAVVEAHDLMERKILAQLNIDIIQLVENLADEYETEEAERKRIRMAGQTYTQFKDGYFPDFVTEKSYLHKNKTRIEWIADFLLAKQDKKHGNVLCFVDSISLGRQIAKIIPGAIFVNGVDVKSAAKREEYYNLFRTRDDVIMIATIHIAGTGLNIPRINEMVTVDLGKSFIRVIQGIGRALRIAHDKTHVTVSDICSDLKYSKKHLALRRTYYTEAKYVNKITKVEYDKQQTLDHSY